MFWAFRKKCCKSISRILYHAWGVTTIIYLRWLLPTTCICLPWTIRRAALKRSYTWHFSTQGLPVIAVTSNNRGLLPHIFTLTVFVQTQTRRLFSVALSRSSSFDKLRMTGSPAVSRMHCSALSGLSYPYK